MQPLANNFAVQVNILQKWPCYLILLIVLSACTFLVALSGYLWLFLLLHLLFSWAGSWWAVSLEIKLSTWLLISAGCCCNHVPFTTYCVQIHSRCNNAFRLRHRLSRVANNLRWDRESRWQGNQWSSMNITMWDWLSRRHLDGWSLNGNGSSSSFLTHGSRQAMQYCRGSSSCETEWWSRWLYLPPFIFISIRNIYFR